MKSIARLRICVYAYVQEQHECRMSITSENTELLPFTHTARPNSLPLVFSQSLLLAQPALLLKFKMTCGRPRLPHEDWNQV